MPGGWEGTWDTVPGGGGHTGGLSRVGHKEWVAERGAWMFLRVYTRTCACERKCGSVWDSVSVCRDHQAISLPTRLTLKGLQAFF